MALVRMRAEIDVPIENVDVSTYIVPTSQPEADGTIDWNSTTLVLVEIEADDQCGIGYTYASKATAAVIFDQLAHEAIGRSALDIPLIWRKMIRSVRNLGRPGAASMAISAMDLALWDLKAKILGVPLCKLLGMSRASAPLYGSGGFTSYSIEKLQAQLAGWAERGIGRVKMKIGAHPADDLARVRAARQAIGPDCALFVDANGAYSRKQALRMADAFEGFGVEWFEEPVSSDDLEGLRLIRDRAPATMEIAAGEYGYDPLNLRRLLEAGAVDVLQIDATRCLGITGFLEASAIAQSFFTDVSSHCAPSVHVALGCSIQHFRHIEYFYDHSRIESLFFDGAPEPVEGCLRPDLSRPGLGISFKQKQAKKYAA